MRDCLEADAAADGRADREYRGWTEAPLIQGMIWGRRSDMGQQARWERSQASRISPKNLSLDLSRALYESHAHGVRGKTPVARQSQALAQGHHLSRSGVGRVNVMQSLEVTGQRPFKIRSDQALVLQSFIKQFRHSKSPNASLEQHEALHQQWASRQRTDVSVKTAS